MKPDIKDYMLHDSICTKYPKQADPWIKDWCLSGGRREWRMKRLLTVYEGSRGGGGEAVPKSGGDDSCTKL